ncbi:hypothetical protein CEXT_138371 [Caerostris extrusa]|uniref:Uncharacterized protein n=1 Tax=Caerostris extrusa TaxID=172846 RepID=A0AAV4VNA4_CAEEX|nr:hypothetical protein CEXT_138371 [Caerostris extrusa]
MRTLGLQQLMSKIQSRHKLILGTPAANFSLCISKIFLPYTEGLLLNVSIKFNEALSLSPSPKFFFDPSLKWIYLFFFSLPLTILKTNFCAPSIDSFDFKGSGGRVEDGECSRTPSQSCKFR